jgi:hypothetical protein
VEREQFAHDAGPGRIHVSNMHLNHDDSLIPGLQVCLTWIRSALRRLTVSIDSTRHPWNRRTLARSRVAVAYIVVSVGIEVASTSRVSAGPNAKISPATHSPQDSKT